MADPYTDAELDLVSRAPYNDEIYAWLRLGCRGFHAELVRLLTRISRRGAHR